VIRHTLRLLLPILVSSGAVIAQIDPGPRGGPSGAGGPISGLTAKEGAFFTDGLDRFNEVDTVASGLGPRFNLNSCAGCHAHPSVGGSSPASNPQVTGGIAPLSQIAHLTGLGLISATGPVREVRFKSDGGVHDLFTVTGMSGAPAGCNISQPAFASHLSEIIFRIPTPTFGNGLIEAIPDSAILANVHPGKPFGIAGHENRNGNDGTLTRYGWKAQNKSLVIFSGEAYNVEQGISNELFPDERGEGGVQDPPVCYVTTSPNDHTNFENTDPVSVNSDAIGFANFMRFLAPPEPACTLGVNCSASVTSGAVLFAVVGCAVCHVPTMQTGNHATAALRNKPAHLFSDLLVHKMGVLGDGIFQGNASGSEFRTAPLWGLGQRLFFLHDGRTKDLLAAIEAHAAGGADTASEAHTVIQLFNLLPAPQKQDILNFLRSL